MSAFSFKKQYARVISNVGNPFTLLLLLTGYASFHFLSHTGAIKVLGIFVVFAFAPTALFIFFKVKKGSYSNYDVSTQSQRPSLYFFSIGLMSLLTTILYLTGEPLFIVKGCAAALVLLALCFVINTRTKCSLHTAFAVFTASGFLQLNLWAGIVFLLFSLLLAWSRVILKRHTVKEVWWGGATGLLVGCFFYFLV